MSDTPPDGAAVPRSRREAREAARRAATAQTPVSPEPAQRPATPPTPTAAPQAAPQPSAARPTPQPEQSAPTAAPAAEPGFQPVPMRTPRPPQPVDVLETEHVDDAWLLAAASGAAPALPYSRGGTATREAPSATAQAGSTPGAVRAGSTATLEDLFSGETSTDDIGAPPPAKNKKRRRIGGWIALGVVLLLLGGVTAGGLYVWNTYEDKIREVMGWEEPKDYEAGLATGEVFVTINVGDTGSPISQALYDAGVTMTPDAFYDYLIDTGQNPNFQPGVYRLQKQMTSEAALAALMDPANRMENTAQLREGLTVEQSLPLLAEATGIPLEEFQAAVADPSAYGVAADSLEGWLFPATYTFDPGVTAPQVIQRLVDRAVQSLDSAGVPVDQRQEILTIASIIEREARYEDDMAKVSRVIQNRLDPSNSETFGLLQMDSTAQYGYGEMHDGTVSSSAEALTDDNPWNTYVHAGLPVGPISNPGDVAIKAAMHPAEGDWLYFVTVNLDTGETVFTSNLADHNRAVSQWQAWCRENPDSGC